MKATSPWITYRTRFLIKAKQLTASLAFTDALGRPHTGRKGDYLVESSDGVLRIAPRQIFEDIYVPLAVGQDATAHLPTTLSPYEALRRDELCQDEPYLNQPSSSKAKRDELRPHKTQTLSLAPPLTRKSPQPYRERRAPSPGLRSL
jgi:hypothetical protein